MLSKALEHPTESVWERYSWNPDTPYVMTLSDHIKIGCIRYGIKYSALNNHVAIGATTLSTLHKKRPSERTYMLLGIFFGFDLKEMMTWPVTEDEQKAQMEQARIFKELEKEHSAQSTENNSGLA